MGVNRVVFSGARELELEYGDVSEKFLTEFVARGDYKGSCEVVCTAVGGGDRDGSVCGALLIVRVGGCVEGISFEAEDDGQV